MGSIRVGIDIGGTFTDLQGVDETTGAAWTYKTPTTPSDPSVGLLAGLEGAAARHGFRLADIRLILHGTTIATNAVLERRLPRGVLLCTAGFRDVLEIGRHARRDVYGLRPRKEAPLIGRSHRIEVAERMRADGSVELALTQEAVAAAVAAVRGAEAVAIALLNSNANGAHERALRDAVAAAWPAVPVSASVDLSPEIREYERSSTCVLNALLMPVVREYLGRLEDRLRAASIGARLLLVQSNGGVCSAATAAAQPARLLLSGPSGGALGAQAAAARLGMPDLVGVDMGGTSFDVCVVSGGRVTAVTQGEVDGLPVRLPMVEIRTIGAGGGPISQTLGFRVAGRASGIEGWIVNDAPDRPNPLEPQFPLNKGNSRQPGGEAYAGRVTLVWTPSDSFDVTGKFFGNYSKDNAESIAEVVCANPNGLPTTLGIPDVYGDCKLDGHRSSSNAPTDPALLGPWPDAPSDGKHYAKFRGLYGSLTANYKTGPLTLTSVSGFYDYRVNTWDNYDYTSIGLVQSVNNDAYRSLSQEFRLVSDFDSPLNFVLGAFYENVYRQQQTNGRIAPLGPDPRNGKYETWDRPAKNWGDTYSGYGQLIYKFGEAVELAGGVRWTREQKRINMEHTFLHSLFPAGVFLPEGVVVAGNFEDTNWSPEGTLTWHPTKQTTLYVAYKTGYKSGGFSNPSALSANYADIDQARFGSESAEGGEIGAKGSFADGRISINAALYRYTFKGLQLSSFNAATTTFTIRNAASARTTGFEVETNVRVTPRLTARTGIGYNAARYLSFPTSSCYAGQTVAEGCIGGVQDLSGTPLVRAPDWSLNTGLSYDQPLGGDLALGLSADGKFTDDYYTQENDNPVALQRAFWLLNASARLHHVDDKWELAFIGRNLTNQRYGLSSADKPLGGPGQISQQPARTRELAIQGTFRF